MREITNYLRMANYAFSGVAEGRTLSPSFLGDLQATLVRGTKDEGSESGHVRTTQVVVGRLRAMGSREFPVRASRYVPPPPGQGLNADVQALVDWMSADHSQAIDPVAAAAMSHYQFESLHPFHDGNGRLGRLLIVLYFNMNGVLREPTLTVSPWFEERRNEYYDLLLNVSRQGAWDPYIGFFAKGIQESADLTHRAMSALVQVQSELKDVVRASPLRAETALLLVDYAVGHTTFTVRMVQRDLGVSYGRANKVVQQLVELDVLREMHAGPPGRRFAAPQVVDVILSV